MFHLWCRKNWSRYWKIQKKYKIAPPKKKKRKKMRVSQKSKTIGWMMESSRGWFQKYLGYNNNSPIPGTAALLVAATHPLLLLVLLQHVGRPTGLQLVRYIQCWQNYIRVAPPRKLKDGHYKLGCSFFQVIFYGNLLWWTTMKSPLGSIFLEHVPSILSRSQVNESLEEEFPLRIDREF